MTLVPALTETWTGLTPPYSTIVADPPWHYDSHATMPGSANKKGHAVKREALPYSTMSLTEIRSVPVEELAAPDAWLFLWTTNAYLPDAFTVMEAWGFHYRQTLVWHKTGNPSPFGGSVAPNHAEFLLVGAHGRPKVEGRHKAGSVIAAPKPYEHSRKPEVFLDIIEEVAPAPRVELFARRDRLGWDSWGYGYEQVGGPS